MDDKTRALLGNRAAQERLTEAGMLLPCPFCGNEFPMVQERNLGGLRIRCPMCNVSFTRDYYETGRGQLGKQRTIEAWNTRAAILPPEQMAALERMEEKQ